LYTDVGGNGPTQVPVTSAGYVNPDNPWEGSSITTPIALTGAVSPFAPPDLVINGVSRDDGYLDIKVKSLTAQLDQSLSFGTLTVVGNYMDTPNKSKSYGPGFLFQQDDTAKQKSAEARLAGQSGPLQWVGGLYYYKEDQTTLYWVDQGFLFNQVGDDMTDLDDETRAVFSQVTYSVNDRLRFTGGLRYTDEDKTQRGQLFNREGTGVSCESIGTTRVFLPTIAARIPFAATNGNEVAYPFPYCRDTANGDLTFHDTSWKAGIDFDVRDDSMVYASVSRGFKAGGFYAAGDHTDVGNSFKPEHLTAYAVGAKNRFLGRRLQLNAEAFFWDYKDHQENYLAPTFAAINSFSFITQAADAEIYGLDLELDALVSDYDIVSVKAQYLHAEYTDAAFRVARPNAQKPDTVCVPTQSAANPTLYTVDCTGQQMPRSPDFSATVDYHHTFKLPNGGSFVPGLNAQYSSSYWSAVDYNPLQRQESYTVWGADLTYDSGKNWSLTAYGANLGDEDIYTNSFMYPATNVAMNSLRAPRTYGARLNVKF
jgi:iron complex outermembrane receptor protein